MQSAVRFGRKAASHRAVSPLRHGAKVQRWRDDMPPRQCTYDQVSD
jgi:hypothetical protein